MHSEVNGDEDIKLKIYKQRNSKLDLKSISEMWTVTQDDIEYKITYIKQITNGDGFHLDVRGIPLFYDKFRTSIIHYLYNGSLTAVDYFTRVFDGTGYNFVLVNPSYAEQWEGFGKGQTRMELFKKGLDRYGYEFYIQGKTIYLKHQIGNDTNFEYRYKLNASNVSKAVDASALITHIKGFGNFEEGEEDYLNNAKLKREATSPLADIIGIREPKVVVDGRITRTDTMDARLQKEIDESLYITVEATLHDIRQMGYETAVPLKGDRAFLVDERIGFDAEIRVQSVTTTKDERDRITQCDVVFGSANAGKRYKANLSTLSKNMADLLAGKIQLPFDVLESMAKDMLLKIQSVDSELLLDNGIFAIDKSNPNNILGLNSAGIYMSTDGGATAQTVITADGIVANSITSGQLLTHLVRVVGTEGLLTIDGDMMRVVNANDLEEYSIIEDGGIEARGKHRRTWLGQTRTHDVSLRFEHGYIRARNNSLGRSLYFSDYGISTYADGEGNNDASGSLLFRDPEFSNAAGGGLTVHSTYGAVALKSEYSRAVVLAEDTVNLESEKYSVYVRPFKDSRNGLNEFQFYVKDNPSTSDTDGALLYGNLTGGATHGSGIRFSKQSSNPKIYATNNNGDIGTGGLHAKEVQAGSIRVLNEGGNLYLGTSTGEVRVTNNLLYNGGDIGYRPIKALAFTQSSSERYKTNIKEVEDIGLSTIKNLSVVEYDLKDDIEQGIEDNRQIGLIAEKSAPVATKDLTGIDLYKMNSYSIKAIQELLERVEKLEGA